MIKHVFLGVLVAIIIFAGCSLQQSQTTELPSSEENREEACWGNNSELGSGPVTYEALPIDSVYFSLVTPLGHLGSSHPVPTGHVYFELSRTDLDATVEGFAKPLSSPANGVITNVTYINSVGYPDYTVKIKHTDNFVTEFGHLSTLESFIMEQLGPDLEKLPGSNFLYITVEAGQVIGKTAAAYGQSACLDMYTGYRAVTLSFIHPEKYGLIPHAVCPLEYFRADLKNYLYANKVLRTKEPRGGKFDYDEQGKLVGNWFHESLEENTADDPYAIGKSLSFAYDMYDPDYLRISIPSLLWLASLEGGSIIYKVEGNGPDFKYTTSDSEEALYSLQNCIEGQESAYKDNPRYTPPISEVVAKILVKMESDEIIKIEYFSKDYAHPDELAKFYNPVFTTNAKYFTR